MLMGRGLFGGEMISSQIPFRNSNILIVVTGKYRKMVNLVPMSL